MAAPDFAPKTVETIAKRAAFRCSSPDCDKLTTAANSIPDKATVIGEAAHIHGARLGTARYREEMSDLERATITNAIWLCRDCHRQIDQDEGRFPADLLLLWKNRHELKILHEIGKPGERLRWEFQEMERPELRDLPLFVKQMLRDRPNYWEHAVAAELLDHFLEGPLRKREDLHQGLYSLPLISMDKDTFFEWLRSTIEEIQNAAASLAALFNALMKTWEPPTDTSSMIHVCKLYGQCAERFVCIAENARFAFPPEEFRGVARCLERVALDPLSKFPELPKFLRNILSLDNPSGEHDFSITLTLPEGWEEEYARELENAVETWTLRQMTEALEDTRFG